MAQVEQTSGKRQQDSEVGRVYMSLGSGLWLIMMQSDYLPEHVWNRLSGGG
jgi:hypothetical protein